MDLNIAIKIVSYAELEKSLKCEQNKKINDTFVDLPPVVEPLEDRNSVPFNQILKNTNIRSKWKVSQV